MLRTLQAYWWPGNIRELENLIERLVAITDKEWLTEEDLPFEFLFAQLDAQPESGGQPVRRRVQALRAQLHPARAREERLERDRTARHLGLPLSTLKFKMERLDVRELAKKLRGVITAKQRGGRFPLPCPRARPGRPAPAVTPTSAAGRRPSAAWRCGP